MTNRLWSKRIMTLLVGLLAGVWGCPAGTGTTPPDNNGGGDGGGDGGGGADGGGDGGGTDGGASETASGTYDQVLGLELEVEGLRLDVPEDALTTSPTLSIRVAATDDLPEAVPGTTGIAAGVFSPDGQTFLVPVEVRVQLAFATILPLLPVLTFDEALDDWVGTGEMADVETDGTEAVFEAEHFSILGVPDPVPIPAPGDPVDSVFALANNGSFISDAISSTMASLLYSDTGSTFSISVVSQEVNDEGQIETKALGLSAFQVTTVDNYVIGIVGGGTSLYNDGQLNEPAVGVMVMSVSEGFVTVSVYAATPKRVIAGTLTGQNSRNVFEKPLFDQSRDREGAGLSADWNRSS